jgi:hypothetical protein
MEKAVAESTLVVEEEAKAEPTIFGDWKLADFDMGMEIPEEQKELFNEMKNEMLTYSTISYKTDGSYSNTDMIDGEVKTQTGTYSVDGNQLTTVSNEGIATTANIVSITAKKVSYSLLEGGTTMTVTYVRK